MSLDATIWAWKITSLTPSQKLILLSLADRANEDHKAHPSIKRLEVDTGLNRKTIQKSIADMIALGVIKDTGERKGRTGQVRVLKLVGVEGRENDPNNGTVKNSKGTKISAKGTKSGTSKRSQKRDTESLIIESPNEPIDENRDLDCEKRFKMTAHWIPSNQIKDLARFQNFTDIEKYMTDDALKSFISYYMAEPKEYNDHQWHNKLINWLKNNKARNPVTPPEEKTQFGKANNSPEFDKHQKLAKENGLKPFQGWGVESHQQFFNRVQGALK